MKEPGEEGVGTFLSIEHKYPAPQGSKVRIEASVDQINGNEIICSYEVYANGYLIATGRQGQKIIDKRRFDSLIQQIEIK